MKEIQKRESLGVAEAERLYLSECMRLQRGWHDQQKSVVVLDSGLLVASKACWESELQELMNMDSICREKYPELGWCEAPAQLIRKALTESDARLRDINSRQASGSSHYTIAKQILSDIVFDALDRKSTDIHLRMTGQEARVAYRVNGSLMHQPSRSRTSITEAIAAVLNTESEDFQSVFDEHSFSAASITLKRNHQSSGQAQEVRVRAQKSPCRDGYTVTLRLQADREETIPQVHNLGFSPETTKTLNELMRCPAGLVLISGPTGHGKTTTLAAMNTVVPTEKKVISLEDPIEIIQPAIEQRFVPTDREPLAFANMIKVVMREDPDVIEVSEIRDLTTASSSITAALTGHLVLSTIHANSSLGILSRLIDLGVDPVKLAQPGLIAGLIAQRLIPELCSYCRVEQNHPEWGSIARLNQSGCNECNSTGIAGRVLVSEVVIPGLEMLNRVANQDFNGLYDVLIRKGWSSLATEAMHLVRACRIDPFIARELVPGLRPSSYGGGSCDC